MEKIIGIKVNTIMNKINVNKIPNPINTEKKEKKEITPLPKDFFETVLECEVKLKQKFNIKIFQKLAYYYSAAVAYYESINDPKFMLYNQNLSLLFSQTEAKNYLAGGKMKEKYKKEKVKKRMECCEKKVNGEKMRNMIGKNQSIDTKKRINNLIEKDMDVQQNDFKRRLAEKKKRYKLSISDNVVNNDIGKNFKNIGINSIDPSVNNESINMMSDKGIKYSDTSNINNITNRTFASEQNSNNNENSSDNKNNIQIVINSIDILNELKNEELKFFENNSFDVSKLDFNSEKSCQCGLNNKNIKFTNKTKFLEKMKFGFEMYSNDYYQLFIKKLSEQIIKDCNNNYNELTQALTDIIVNSINQEKELKYLITSDCEDTYMKEINTIINELKEEDKKMKEKLISENNENIDKIKNKYSPINTFQFDHDIEMLKEKLKLEITKSMNNLVFK